MTYKELNNIVMDSIIIKDMLRRVELCKSEVTVSIPVKEYWSLSRSLNELCFPANHIMECDYNSADNYLIKHIRLGYGILVHLIKGEEITVKEGRPEESDKFFENDRPGIDGKQFHLTLSDHFPKWKEEDNPLIQLDLLPHRA